MTTTADTHSCAYPSSIYPANPTGSTKRPTETARTLTKSRRHLFSRMAPQQPRKPSRKSIAPMASMMYAPVKSRGLAATISRKPVGSTMTQIPSPSRHAPPSCHSTRTGERGRQVNTKQLLQKNWIHCYLWIKDLENLCFCKGMLCR